MNKKYELTGETKTVIGKTLHRIRALRDFTLPNGAIVHCGDLGGFVESEANLSHEGTAWVGGDAIVHGNARVLDNAQVFGNAMVFGYAEVYGNAMVYGDAVVFGNAKVFGYAEVYGNAMVFGYAEVFDDALVSGTAWARGNAKINRRAVLSRTHHYFVCGPCGSEDNFVTFYRTLNNTIWVSCGCFNGRIDDFLKKVTATHGDNKHAQVYRQLAEVARTQIEGEDAT